MITKKIINSIIFFVIIAISLTSNAISVSVSSVCKNNINSYNFASYTYDPDFEIVFSSTAFDPDFTVKVVDNELSADIVVQDNKSIADFEVCESINGQTVKISNYGYDPDITIFNNSKIISTEEAISILIIPEYSILNLKTEYLN